MFLLFASRLPYWVIVIPPWRQRQGDRKGTLSGGQVCPCSTRSLFVIDDGAFDLFDQVGYVDAAWAGIGAVENGTAAPYAFLLAQDGETFGRSLVATVEDEAVSIHDGSRANPI